jgi:hypothetical protein
MKAVGGGPMKTLALCLAIVLVAVAGPALGTGPQRARSAPVLLDAAEEEIGVLVSLVERSGSSVGIAPWAVVGIEGDDRQFGLELNSDGEFQSSCDNWSLLCYEDSNCSGQPYLLANPGCRTQVLGLELAAVVGDKGWLPLVDDREGRWIEVYSASMGYGTCITQPGVEIFAVPAEMAIDLGSFTSPYRLTLEPSKKNPR